MMTIRTAGDEGRPVGRRRHRVPGRRGGELDVAFVPGWISTGLRAVLDAAGSRRVAITGRADGAAVALLFAAMDPERVTALVVGSVVSRAKGDGTNVPVAIHPQVMDQWAEAIEWGVAPLRRRARWYALTRTKRSPPKCEGHLLTRR